MNAIKIWLVNFNESMPRLWKTALLTVAAIVFLAVASVDQFGVLYKKCLLVAVAAVVGYYIDRTVFPYARPHNLNIHDGTFNWSCIRRAIIIAATLLAFALGA